MLYSTIEEGILCEGIRVIVKKNCRKMNADVEHLSGAVGTEITQQHSVQLLIPDGDRLMRLSAERDLTAANC